MENDPYQLNEVSENTFYSIILISQTPFYNEKKYFKTIEIVLKKEIGLNINLPAFNVDILKCIVILLMY